MRYEKYNYRLKVTPEIMQCKENYESIILKDKYIPQTNKLLDITNDCYVYEQDGENLKEWLHKEDFTGYKNNNLKKDDITSLIFALNNALSYLEDYLISENSIILDFETITKKGDTWLFTIIPNLNRDFSYELSKMLIRLLRYVDVYDKGALNIAYRLFVASSKDNYTITDLLRIIK